MTRPETNLGTEPSTFPGPGRAARRGMAIAVLGVLLLALAAANLCMGSVPMTGGELLGALRAPGASDTLACVVWDLRLPRLAAAAVLGGALALAGVLLQTLFNNPIAGPYVLGVSSGAKLAVAVVMVLLVGRTGVMASWMQVLAAFVGALAVMLVALAAARHVRTPSALVLVGVMVGYVCSALTDLLVTFASDASVVSLRAWSQGSFSGTSWEDVRVLSAVVLAASACAFWLSKSLGAYQLGESYAQSVGVNVPAFRTAVVVLSSLLSACVTAFAGPVSFVGVAVPHLVRRMLGTSKPLYVVPASLLGGADFCLLSDLVARTAFAPVELPVSTITAILGAPVVIGVLLGRRRRKELG